MNVTNYCRLCCEKKSHLVSLLENYGAIYLKALIAVEVSESDNLPKNACSDCWNRLQEAYSIQQRFRETDKLIRSKFRDMETENSKCNINTIGTLSTVPNQNKPALSECLEKSQINDISTKINNTCKICGKQYKYETSLKKHYILAHRNNLVAKNENVGEISVIISDDEGKNESNIDVTGIRLSQELKVVSTFEKNDNSKHKSQEIKEQLKCVECNKIYTNKKIFHAHIRNHTQMDCSVCGVKVSRYYLRAHMKTHTDGPQKCPICQQVLKHKRTLKFHIDTVHNSNTNHTNSQQICYICGKNLKCVRILKRHLKNLHQIQNTASKEFPSLHTEEYNCLECNKKFLDRQKYMSHVNNHRRKECPVCKQSISRFNYTKHVRLHSEGPQNCHLCGTTCKNSESLRGHVYYTHSTKEYKCDKCEKSFKHNFHRIMHIKLHHTGERNHICDYCGKGFISLYQVKNHIKIHHSDSKPYTCITCDKCFSNIKALLQHERKHSAESNYTCSICLETFPKKTDLRIHKSSEHKTVEMKTCECQKCSKIFSSEFALKKHSQKNHDDMNAENTHNIDKTKPIFNN